MSVRITSVEKKVALFDSASGWAFGPTFDSETEADSFLEYVEDMTGLDPRMLHTDRLDELYMKWVEEQS